jgi:hypothetical protein
MVWTQDLHQRFLEAVQQIGVDQAVPKKIMQVCAAEVNLLVAKDTKKIPPGGVDTGSPNLVKAPRRFPFTASLEHPLEFAISWGGCRALFCVFWCWFAFGVSRCAGCTIYASTHECLLYGHADNAADMLYCS